MNSEPDKKLTLEWVKRPDGAVILDFYARTWKAFEKAAEARETSAENMIITAIVETFGLEAAKPVENPSLAFLKTSGGAVSLLFDARTWMMFEQVAKARETSTEHMIVKAVVGTFGAILADNYVLNRFLRA
jgi:hypothetical protein